MPNILARKSIIFYERFNLQCDVMHYKTTVTLLQDPLTCPSPHHIIVFYQMKVKSWYKSGVKIHANTCSSNVNCLTTSMMNDPRMILALILLSLWSTASITAVNISDCVTNPTGKVSLDIDVVGVPGPQGPKGELGETGIQGQKGSSGEKGMKGARGYPGERGPVGAAGHPGIIGDQGPPGDSGQKGQKGERGYTGVPGHPGVIGPRGYPGDTVLTEDEFARATQTVQQNISTQLKEISKSLSDIKSAFTKCGIYDTNWRRVAYIDTTQGTTCPSGLREVTNSALNKRACGRSVSKGCSSVTFPSGGNYTHVCGRARGYQFYTTDAFRAVRGNGINEAYVDGLSITRGSPRKHIWTYASGHHEKSSGNGHPYQSPCTADGYNPRHKASFIGNDYYCESAFVDNARSEIAWENTLWDGEGCTLPENTCCRRSQFGWFHKEVSITSDNLEVRWCCDQSQADEDIFTDILEIWVL